MKRRISAFFMLLVFTVVFLSGCWQQSATDYSDSANWAYLEVQETEKTADVFFVCPTVYSGTADAYNMKLSDKNTKEKFVGAIHMEKGIYDTDGRFFAPYYRQIGLTVYRDMEPEEREQYLELAYEDVKGAFEYYMEEYNDGRPIIVAGFSQGADMCIRLMKDCFADDKTNQLLVACYAIGWCVTEEELAENPHLKFASGETDTGVIISFNSEDGAVDDSLLVPKGEKTLAINPLNWKTDDTPADKSENLGACFTDYDGNIKEEIPNFTGAYIDLERGTLKVTDVDIAEYGTASELFAQGVYHVYDYQFFYRNIQENVEKRLAAYQS